MKRVPAESEHVSGRNLKRPFFPPQSNRAYPDPGPFALWITPVDRIAFGKGQGDVGQRVDVIWPREPDLTFDRLGLAWSPSLGDELFARAVLIGEQG